MRIFIPANQTAKKNEFINVNIVHNNTILPIGLLCMAERTSTASYSIDFHVTEYNPDIHAFAGIEGALSKLVEWLSDCY